MSTRLPVNRISKYFEDEDQVTLESPVETTHPALVEIKRLDGQWKDLSWFSQLLSATLLLPVFILGAILMVLGLCCAFVAFVTRLAFRGVVRLIGGGQSDA